MSEKNLIFSVDAGKGFTKYAKALDDGSINKGLFMTRFTKVEDLNSLGLVGNDSFMVKYKDEQYILGVQGKYDLRDQRTKKNDMHRLSTLVAVTQMLESKTSGAKIDLVISMPAGSYKKELERIEYENFYKGEGAIEIEVNDIGYSFEIKNVLSMPEGSGFLFKYGDLCRNKVAIIDIGHLNINLISLQDGNIMDMSTLDEGGLELETLAFDKLETELQKKVGRDVIVETLKQGYYTSWGNKVESSTKVIKDLKIQYVNDILRKANERRINLEEHNKVFFIGGTPLLLIDMIESHEQLSKVSEVKEDGRWINVEGNLVFATAYFNKTTKESDISEQQQI